MTRGDSTSVTAAASVDFALPPREVLPGSGTTESKGIILTCTIEARLNASPWDLNISNTGWMSASFLTSETVTWTWYVSPKVGGTQTLILSVKPFVKESGSAEPTPEQYDVANYTITAHVHVPWTQVPAEIMSSIAANLKIADGLVKAATTLVLAVLALLTATGLKKRRKKKRAGPSHSEDKVPVMHV